MKKTLTNNNGQPCWQIKNDSVHIYLTEQGGHIGPVQFTYNDEQGLEKKYSPIFCKSMGRFLS